MAILDNFRARRATTGSGTQSSTANWRQGFFGRRDRSPGHANNTKATSRRSRRSRSRGAMFDIDSGQFNRRPSFGQWIKFTWLDLVTMFCMGLIGLGVYEAHPAPTRSFPVYFQDGEIVYPEFAYPLRKEIVPIWLAALLGSLIPIFIILCMQIRIRSFWDANNAIIGLLYSLISAAVFQVFLKWLIGGLRPHFLTVCQPDIPVGGIPSGKGFGSIMYDRSICTGDRNQIDDSLESFPSGHSTAAFAGFGFLYFYLNAKLKVFSNHHPAMWKLIALYAPILGATLIAGALTIDEFHNWYDCLAGAIIGSMMAISAYRMVYASVWDFRFNHIPLTRHTPFSYGAGEGAAGFETTVFTRAAGWGYEEAFGGAPFDAAHGLRGFRGRHGQPHGTNNAGVMGGGTGGGGTDPMYANSQQHGYGNHQHAGNIDTGTGAAYGNRDSYVSGHQDGIVHDTATTPTAGNQFRHHNRSVERRPVPTRDADAGAVV